MKVILPYLRLNIDTKQDTQDLATHSGRTSAVLQSLGVSNKSRLYLEMCVFDPRLRSSSSSSALAPYSALHLLELMRGAPVD